MLLLFTFGVQLLATEKSVWSTISYNPPIIVYWQVTALEKDLCLLAPACLPMIARHITAMRDSENNVNLHMKLPCQVKGTTPGQSSLDYKPPP